MAGKDFEILHFTDIHDAARFFDIISGEISKADAIIISGDITHFGNRHDAEKLVDRISALNNSIFAVAGNCDSHDIESYLLERGIGLHDNMLSFGNISLAGIGGSLPCPGTTPYEYSDEQLEDILRNLKKKIVHGKPLILVTHQPPFNTINDIVLSGLHTGSHGIRRFISETGPIVCLTGHIHEGRGIDNIAGCKIINPGPFRYGYYASLKISPGNEVSVSLKQATVK